MRLVIKGQIQVAAVNVAIIILEFLFEHIYGSRNQFAILIIDFAIEWIDCDEFEMVFEFEQWFELKQYLVVVLVAAFVLFIWLTLQFLF